VRRHPIMCGILGEIRFDGTDADLSALEKMARVMKPRGPDGEGIIRRNNIGLGHRRLKIIDLSDCSQQPMVDSKLGLSLVFNGAIYNYSELRVELESLGYLFFSGGDTEVILKSYHAWGASCVEKFNGMFAFAVVERDSGRVFMARDRVGIKPFYYVHTPQVFRFASTLPALLAAGGVDTSIDPVALHHYMTFHSIVPPPRTILNGVKKLPPATRAFLESDGSISQDRYWTPTFGMLPGDESRTDEDWINETLSVLRSAVRRRLVADVPVGVLLSGGLDSSLITGLLCEHGRSGIETFSIGFESVGNEEGDEFKYSDIVSTHFGTNHHKLFIDSTKALPALRHCISQMSEPMVSHDNVGFYLLSQEVAKHVKVVQSGQGADEIFGGYHWYPPMLNASDPLTTYGSHFFDRSHKDYLSTVSSRFHVEDHSTAFVRSHFDMPGAESGIDKALRLDTLVMLVDDPVKRVDNNTMAASLEARVPFLDHEVIEFAARVPARLKISGDGKYILKEAGRRVIPSEVIDRPKGYFPVPALKYLRGDFLDMAREALLCSAAKDRGLFQSKVVEAFLASPETHITPLRGSKLWQLSLLELWLQNHGI
jgi:asparagine synthase (glutamine-hydrolysing)